MGIEPQVTNKDSRLNAILKTINKKDWESTLYTCMLLMSYEEKLIFLMPYVESLLKSQHIIMRLLIENCIKVSKECAIMNTEDNVKKAKDLVDRFHISTRKETTTYETMAIIHMTESASTISSNTWTNDYAFKSIHNYICATKEDSKKYALEAFSVVFPKEYEIIALLLN